jgi:hypothetical protein
LGGALGGLVGANNGSVSNSYALGNVTSTNVNMITYDVAGGLMGDNTGTITNSYALGAVTGGSGFGSGPLVGSNWNVIASSYWNTDTTLRSNVAGNGLATLAGTPLTNVTGLTTAQMQQQTSYLGWDFVNTWQIAPNAYPTLKAFTLQPTAQIITPTPPVIPPVTPPVVTPPVTPPAKPVVVTKPVTPVAAVTTPAQNINQLQQQTQPLLPAPRAEYTEDMPNREPYFKRPPAPIGLPVWLTKD